MKQTGIEVELIGQDGNIFFIMGAVSKALKRGGYRDLAVEYVTEVTSSGSYAEALAITSEYVEIV